MLNAPPSPIAVAGPVEPPLLVARVRHYRCPDIERFLIAFHLPDQVPDTQQHDLQTVLRELGILPTATSSGAYAQNYDFTEKKAKYFTGRHGVSTSALTSQVLQHQERVPTLLRKRQQRLVGLPADEWDL
ncbi:hypothetical protein ACGFN1_17220 [Streptomyces sp. NPDC048685]|uniref:hypothetical protein n=1 Tax=Streptomyces sp. NPDC048685 TaxID=3365584 RepID=UPI0037240EBA